MELERAIISYILAQLKEVDVITLKEKLEIALQLIDGLSAWDAEKALKIIFGGVKDAE